MSPRGTRRRTVRPERPEATNDGSVLEPSPGVLSPRHVRREPALGDHRAHLDDVVPARRARRRRRPSRAGRVSAGSVRASSRLARRLLHHRAGFVLVASGHHEVAVGTRSPGRPRTPCGSPSARAYSPCRSAEPRRCRTDRASRDGPNSRRAPSSAITRTPPTRLRAIEPCGRRHRRGGHELQPSDEKSSDDRRTRAPAGEEGAAGSSRRLP